MPGATQSSPRSTERSLLALGTPTVQLIGAPFHVGGEDAGTRKRQDILDCEAQRPAFAGNAGYVTLHGYPHAVSSGES